MKETLENTALITIVIDNLNSTALGRVIYTGNSIMGTMQVKFQSESVYQYHDVPLWKAVELSAIVKNGGSVGSFFAKHIRNEHQFTLVA